jgi:hypothetical protein
VLSRAESADALTVIGNKLDADDCLIRKEKIVLQDLIGISGEQ